MKKLRHRSKRVQRRMLPTYPGGASATLEWFRGRGEVIVVPLPRHAPVVAHLPLRLLVGFR